jgi:hypothetical protein
MAWVESTSPTFAARHEFDDSEDAARVLEQLEDARRRLDELFQRSPDELTIVLHRSPTALYLAQPYLPLARARTAPAGRRYQVGWFGSREIHVLSPAALERRASRAEGSREALMLAPVALYSSVVVGTNNPELPPPFTLSTFNRLGRWAWLAQGAAQFFSGQVPHLRAAIGRRLREGRAPAFPPSRRDAALLGGTVFDLLAREADVDACVRLAGRLSPAGHDAVIEKAFDRRARDVEGDWRAHLARIAGG